MNLQKLLMHPIPMGRKVVPITIGIANSFSIGIFFTPTGKFVNLVFYGFSFFVPHIYSMNMSLQKGLICHPPKADSIGIKRKFLLKFLLSLSLCAGFRFSLISQNLNLTLSDQLTYPTQTLSNIAGWTDPQDNKEYALVGAENGLSIVDVSNPASVFEVVQIPGPSSTWREIKTNGNYAYVTTEDGAIGLQIVDLINLPATTLTTATWTPTINSQTLETIHALHIDNGKVYLYGSDVGGQGAVIADIATNPMAPVYLGSYDNNGYIHDGYVRNDTLYAGHIYAGTCEIVNLTNPASGISLAQFPTPGNFTHNTWLSAGSKTVFTTDEVSDSYLASFDLTNLGNISELDRIQSNPGSNSIVHNTHIVQIGSGEFAVSSWYKDGITVVDVTRPANMVQVGNYDTYTQGSGNGFDGCWGVYPFLPSTTIVVSDMSNGLFVLAPAYVRACYLEGTVYNCTGTNPLSGVQVQIQNAAYNSNSATDITDAFGKYGVGVATAGTYTVTYSKTGYTTQTFTVSLTSGNVVLQNVNLCTQTPPFTFTGNVFDNATSLGIAGANVHFQDGTGSLVYDTITNASGNYTISGMLAGTYEIIAGKWGYVTRCFSGQNITSSTSPINIGLDKGYYDDFSFDFGWTVSGSSSNSWERGVPVGTQDNGNSNAWANPDADVTDDCSDQCYVTDNGGGGAWDNDVDPPGSTILTSPVFNATIFPIPYLSYARWFYNHGLFNGPPNDTMSIELTDGTSTVLLETILNSLIDTSTGKWATRLFKISDYLTPNSTMQIIITTADASPGNIVEGGLDKFIVMDSATITVNEVSSSSFEFIVYPNPTDGMFNVKWLMVRQKDGLSQSGATGNWQLASSQKQEASIEIYNVYGEKVTRSVIPSGERNLTVDLSETPNGVYFLYIKIEEGMAVKKLIIQK